MRRHPGPAVGHLDVEIEVSDVAATIVASPTVYDEIRAECARQVEIGNTFEVDDQCDAAGWMRSVAVVLCTYPSAPREMWIQLASVCVEAVEAIDRASEKAQR